MIIDDRDKIIEVIREVPAIKTPRGSSKELALIKKTQAHAPETNQKISLPDVHPQSPKKKKILKIKPRTDKTLDSSVTLSKAKSMSAFGSYRIT